MLRVVLVGFGYWGKNWARQLLLHSNIQLVAVSDSCSKKKEDFITTYTDIDFVSDYKDSLSLNIDAAIVATPVVCHFEISKFFLKNNVNVLCEKPLSIKRNEIFQLDEIAKKKKLVLMVGHIFQFNCAILKIKSILESKQLGNILYVKSSRTGLGPLRQDVDVITDLATHDIYILNFLFDELPTKVKTEGKHFLVENRFDIANLCLNYESGFYANIFVSWISSEKEREIKIVGTNGMLIYNELSKFDKVKIINLGVNHLMNESSIQLLNEDSDIEIPYIEYTEPLKNELDHFVNCILQKRKPLTDSKCALKVALILELINDSIGKNED